MSPAHQFVVRTIGIVRSPIARRGDGPKQGREGAPDAWLEVEPDVVEGIAGIAAGDARSRIR